MRWTVLLFPSNKATHPWKGRNNYLKAKQTRYFRTKQQTEAMGLIAGHHVTSGRMHLGMICFRPPRKLQATNQIALTINQLSYDTDKHGVFSSMLEEYGVLNNILRMSLQRVSHTLPHTHTHTSCHTHTHTFTHLHTLIHTHRPSFTHLSR
jgi:hypothetical protein